MNLKAYSKFVVALVGLIVLALHAQHVDVAKDLSAQLISALTALGVLLFPNH